MLYEKLDELFYELNAISGVKDIGVHEIADGRLNPVYKTNTDTLGIKKWRQTHAARPVYIEKTPVLKEVIASKRPVAIDNTKQDMRSDDAFFFFGIDSILIVPITEGERVKGIVCIASIGALHSFSEEEIIRSKDAVNKYFNMLDLTGGLLYENSRSDLAVS